MTRLSWGSTGDRKYEAGVDRGVFYPHVGPGLPWHGLVSVQETPSGAETKTRFVDGNPLRTNKTKESFAATIQAMISPRGFELYEAPLTQQRRNTFGLSYRTRIGNDISGLDHGHKIHLVYGALATPTAMDSSSVNPDSLDLTPFSWQISTTPVEIPGATPAAHLIIDTSIAHAEAIQAVEDVLYGSDEEDARLPDPVELLDLFEQHAILVIIDHGDGNWTAIGPDDMVYMIDDDTFEISSPTLTYLDDNTYQVSSL